MQRIFMTYIAGLWRRKPLPLLKKLLYLVVVTPITVIFIFGSIIPLVSQSDFYLNGKYDGIVHGTTSDNAFKILYLDCAKVELDDTRGIVYYPKLEPQCELFNMPEGAFDFDSTFFCQANMLAGAQPSEIKTGEAIVSSNLLHDLSLGVGDDLQVLRSGAGDYRDAIACSFKIVGAMKPNYSDRGKVGFGGSGIILTRGADLNSLAQMRGVSQDCLAFSDLSKTDKPTGFESKEELIGLSLQNNFKADSLTLGVSALAIILLFIIAFREMSQLVSWRSKDLLIFEHLGMQNTLVLRYLFINQVALSLVASFLGTLLACLYFEAYVGFSVNYLSFIMMLCVMLITGLFGTFVSFRQAKKNLNRGGVAHG